MGNMYMESYEETAEMELFLAQMEYEAELEDGR